MVIFGENHHDKEECEEILSSIKLFNPDYLLHEMLYEDAVFNSMEAHERLINCKTGGLCDPRINRDLYEFAYKTNIPVIGIDMDLQFKHLNLKEQFKIRENRMIEMIEKYKTKGSIVIVVGDTHLRISNIVELNGHSPIWEKYKNEFIIIRSRDNEII